MTCIIVKDGTGEGFSARVGSDNRLATSSISKTITQQSVANGNGYNIATPRITLTSSNESGILYLKNDEVFDIGLTSLFLNTVDPVGNLSGQAILKIYRNPLDGTLLSAQDAVSANNIINQNFGSAVDLLATVYKGSEGSTILGTEKIIEVPLPSIEAMPLFNIPIDVVVPRGSSYAISYQPQPGITSLDVICGVTAILLTDEVS